MNKTKVCPKCGQKKHLDQFTKTKARKDGLAYWCRQCASARYKSWYKINYPKKTKEKLPKGKKRCSKCGQIKNLGDFHKNKNNKDGYQGKCKECRNAYHQKLYRKSHPDLKEPEIFPEGKKRCTVCNELKSLDSFYISKLGKFGVSSWCKTCSSKLTRQKYRKEHPNYRKKEVLPRGIRRCPNCGEVKKFNQFSKSQLRKNGISVWCQKCEKEYRRANREKLNALAKISRYSKVAYDSYCEKLTIEESVKPDKNGYLMSKCAYCGRYFYPKRIQITHRIMALKGKEGAGEARLYCSDYCKRACPIFKKINWPADFKQATSREVQPELRQMRLELDDYSCQRCEKTVAEAELHCHHLTGVAQNPIESADLDNCITLCKKCHKWAHTQAGCRYFELRC